MKRILPLCFMALAVPASTLEGPESLRASAAGSFQALPAFRGRAGVTTLDQGGAPPPGRRVSRRSRYLRLSGHLYLSGSTFVPPGTAYATVTLTGWTTLSDQEGRLISGQAHFSDTSSYYVGSRHVSGYARPYTYVTLYRDGRWVGSVRVEGTILVSGFVNGNHLNLSGSGLVSGSAWVDEEDVETP